MWEKFRSYAGTIGLVKLLQLRFAKPSDGMETSSSDPDPMRRGQLFWAGLL